MRKIFFVFLALTTTATNAQHQIVIDAVVLNEETGEHLQFVNINILNKEVKTISNINGKISLTYDENLVSKKDSIEFTKVNYTPIKVEISQLYKLLKNTNKIYLKPKKRVSKKVIDNKENNLGNIYGQVTDINNVPLQNVVIKIKNSLNETKTDVNGNFRIDADIEDILVFDYLGMETKEIQIADTSKINISLKSDGEILEEIYLEGEGKKEEKIDLGFGQKKNFDAIGTSISIMTEKDIGSQHYKLKEVLTGKFAGVNVGDGDPPAVMLRGSGSLSNKAYAAYDIDGVVYGFDDIGAGPPYVDPQNIKSIMILKSLAATNKYGSRGRGGVIIIRTKMYGSDNTSSTKNEPPALLLEGNEYHENLELLDTISISPSYLNQLNTASSFKKAKNIYLAQRNKSQISIPYLIDVSNYFLKWDKKYASTILEDINTLAYNNPKALKTLAYSLEALGEFEKAKLVYQRIASLQPKEAQVYRDLALIYTQTKNYIQALELYRDMLNNNIDGVDFSGLNQIIINELKQFIAKNRDKVDYSNIHADYLDPKFKYDIRIVIDWNDTNTEFIMQFVNPQKKFFNWNQTLFKNKDRMLNGITKGYYTEEFIIDDDEAGEWLINIEPISKTPKINPTYLKYTVYKNYGLANETKEIKIINLNNIESKLTIDKLINN